MRLVFLVSAFTAVLGGCSMSFPTVSQVAQSSGGLTQSQVLSESGLYGLRNQLLMPTVRSRTSEDGELPYTLLAGFRQNEGVRAAASLDDDIAVSPTPVGTSVAMEGRYHLIDVTDIMVLEGERNADDTLYGETRFHSGQIDLVADFSVGTLRGQDEETGHMLTVNGRILNGALSGRFSYGDISGNLTGVIGGNRAVAVFEGTAEDAVVVGGFDVSP